MGITYKEYVYLTNDKCLDDGYRGGVEGCPHLHISFLKPQDISECRIVTCTDCWNRQLKYPVIAQAVRDGHAVTERQFATYAQGEKAVVTDVVINGSVYVADYNGDIYDISDSLHDFRFYIDIPMEGDGEGMNKEFTKADLKTGMVVETKNGNKYMVYGDRLVRSNYFNKLSCYDNDLKNKNNEDYDIIRCFDINSACINCIEDILNIRGGKKILWERKPEEKIISSDEAFKILKEHYGCDVKIKGI